MKCIVLVGLVALLGAVAGEDTPTCPQRTPMHNYDCHSFHGTWYILMRSATDHFDQHDLCTKIIIEDRPNGTIAFWTKYVKPGESEYTSMEGNYWRTEEQGTDGVAWVNYPENFGDWKGTYNILGTDYNEYAVTWACWVSKKGVLHDHAWVLGRSTEMTDAIREKANEVAQANNLDLSSFVPISHANCPAH